LLLIFACLATCTVSENFTGIVKKLFSKFESSLEKKMNEKIIKIQNEMEEKVEGLLIMSELFLLD
jgi:hypothetical protein